MTLSLTDRIRLRGLPRRLWGDELRRAYDEAEARDRLTARLAALAAERKGGESLSRLRAQFAAAVATAPAITSIRWIEDMLLPRTAEEPDAVIRMAERLRAAAVSAKAVAGARETGA